MGCIKNPIKGVENSFHDIINVVKDPTAVNIAKASNVGGNFLSPGAEMAVADTVASAFGGAPLIPLINAGITTATDVAGGESVGKSLGQGAISGAESLAFQEAGGAVGLGAGNSIFNSSLGITGDNPSSLGLPDLGSSFNNTLSSLGITGDTATSSSVDPAAFSSDSALTPEQQQFLQNPNPLAGAGAAPSPTALAGSVSPAATAATPTIGQNISQGNIMAALKQLGITPMSALAGGGLALSALKGNSQTGAEKNASAAANAAQNTGSDLITQGTAGQLPPGQAALLQSQLDSQITSIRSQYAQMGMSGSTSEMQAINQAKQNMANQLTQLAQAEVTTGLSALNQGGAANSAIAQQQLASDQGLSAAIAALSGSGGTAAATQKAA